MIITKELLLSIILKYLNEKREVSFYELEKITGKDRKSLHAWAIQKNRHVQTRSFNTVINALQNEIYTHFDDFSEYTLLMLEKNGITRDYVQEIFDDDNSIKKIINKYVQKVLI